jgi:mono/diheme cytochrome c family protein
MTLADYIRPVAGGAIACVWLTMAAGVLGGGGDTTGSTNGWQIPALAETESNPEPNNAVVLEKGRALYKKNCQRCHGADGSGRGPDADPEHPPANLTDRRVATRNPDGVMFYKIWNGRSKPKMPAMKVELTRTDVWALVHYVKTLRK